MGNELVALHSYVQSRDTPAQYREVIVLSQEDMLTFRACFLIKNTRKIFKTIDKNQNKI